MAQNSSLHCKVIIYEMGPLSRFCNPTLGLHEDHHGEKFSIFKATYCKAVKLNQIQDEAEIHAAGVITLRFLSF